MIKTRTLEERTILDRRFGCLRRVVEPPVERLHVREHTFPIGFPHDHHVFDVQQWSYTGFVLGYFECNFEVFSTVFRF